MKKLKKFYQDNEKTIMFVAGGVVGSFSAAYATAFYAQSAVNAVKLADANLYKIAADGQMFLRVTLTNGTTRDYLWKAAEVAA